MQQRKHDYLTHIIQAASEAISFVETMSFEAFLQSARTQKAVLMNLVIIGEAATKLVEKYPEILEEFPNTEWIGMKGMRNRLVHAYFGVDNEIVWETVKSNLPHLIEEIEAVLIQLEHGR